MGLVIPQEHPVMFFNILAKTRVFKGCKVSAIFLVEVFCLLEPQGMCLVVLASREEMLPTCYLVSGSLGF